jgi:putative protein kinase ArgK-like GTPase of G3E family
MDQHLEWLIRSGERTRRRGQRLASRVRDEVERSLRQAVWQEQGGEDILRGEVGAMERGERTPYEVAQRIVAAAVNGSESGKRGS